MHPPTHTSHVRAALSTNLFVGFTWEPFSWYSAINWRFSYTVPAWWIKSSEGATDPFKTPFELGFVTIIRRTVNSITVTLTGVQWYLERCIDDYKMRLNRIEKPGVLALI